MRFSKADKEALNKSFYELLNGSFQKINEKDEKGETILHQAARMSNKEKVSFLVGKGADINTRDEKGYTPLHWAALAKRLENVKELIRLGAEINVTEYGSEHTPLHLACMKGAGRIIKELVKGGAEVNQLSKFGITPMYYIRNSEKHKEVKKFLEKEGGIVRDTPKICDEVEEWFEETIETWSRKLLPELEGKELDLDEIKKRDKSLIERDLAKCGEKGGKLLKKMERMSEELN